MPDCQEKELDLTCPCMPQCPNYGKCRVCIAMHAEHYTAPKCVRMMQEKMKKEHIHPTNPHQKKTLTDRIQEIYESNPGAHLRELATSLKVTDWQVLDALPDAISIPVEAFGEVYDAFATLDHVLLHIDGGAAVVQVETKLPKRMKMRTVNVVKQASGDMSLTSLILEDDIYALFLVRENLYGKESLSFAIVDNDERNSISFYLPRVEDKIEEKAKSVFETLFEKYK